MQKCTGFGATAALLLASVCPQVAMAQERRSPEKEEKKDNTAAIVLGGLAVVGAGIAIASKKHGNNHNHNNNWDSDYYGEPFSPANNVVCVPNQRKCYDRGNFSYSWTKRIFGSNAGFGGSGGTGWGGSGGSGWDGSGGTADYGRAQEVCIERGERKGLRNILIESVTPNWGNNRIDVIMQSRRSSASVNFDRYRCRFYYNNSTTSIERV